MGYREFAKRMIDDGLTTSDILKHIHTMQAVTITQITYSELEVLIENSIRRVLRGVNLISDKNDSRGIEELNISARVYNILKSNRINTVVELLKLTKKDILRLKGAGQKTVDEIGEALNINL